MLGPKDLPYAVTGERCFIKVDPPKKKTIIGIELPAEAMLKAFSGTLLDAGLAARDKLRDHGYKIGDHVMFGRFAGIIEEWDHIISGPSDLPDSEYDWSLHSNEPGEPVYYKCQKTGAMRTAEPCVVLNCDDLLASVELEQRRRAGQVEYAQIAVEERLYHVIREKELNANGHA